jgi:hypothetical protein
MVRITLIPIALFVIIGLILLLIGLIFSSPKTRCVLLWILGAIVLIPAVLFLLLIAVRFKVDKSNSPGPIVVTQTVAGMPSVWKDEIEEQFGAKVYSSPQKAAFGLGKLIAEKHKTLLAGQLEIIKGAESQTKAGGPKQIILCEDTADVNMFEHLRNGLRQSLSGLEILIQNRTSGGPSAGQVWILLDSQDQSNSFNVQDNLDDPVTFLTIGGNQSGIINAILQTPDDKFTERAEYDWRPWIHDMSGFKLQNNRQWLAVFSDTATDLETAQKQVYDKACSILSQSIQASGYPPTDVLKGNLQQFGLVADSYSQELEGMTGPVWRFALLLDADSWKLAELVQSKTQMVVYQRSTWVKMGLSLAGMMVIIWIAYSVANAATKGYYSVLFAILAILAMVVVGLLVFFG